MNDQVTAQDRFTADLRPGADTALKIGTSTDNKVGIVVTYKGTDKPKVRVTVTVHCGSDPSALLHSTNASIAVTSNLVNSPTFSKSDTTERTVSWRSRSAGDGLTKNPFFIDLKNFACSTPPGKAKIDLKAEIEGPDETFSTAWSKTLDVDKPDPAAAGLAYFTISPNFVLQAGATDVSLSILAKRFKAATLLRNNEQVLAWRDECRKIERGAAVQFVDRPSITTVYRLEVTDDKDIRQSFDRTVQVISAGWNRLVLPQGYPTWLFVAPDFSGDGGRRLYGIFVDANNKASLHSSATGVDNWREEPGEIPRRMADSPGVVFQNKLWLIGGKSFDEDEAGNEIWCYEQEQDSKTRRWVERKDLRLDRSPELGGRSCHACVVVPVLGGGGTIKEDLWLIGGASGGNAFQDVWTCDGQAWKPAEGPPWTGRYKHAAAVRGSGADVEAWVYGGIDQGGNALSDLWVWKSRPNGSGEWTKGLPPNPSPGRGKAVTLTAASEPSTGQQRQITMLGTFLPSGDGNLSVSRIMRWQTNNKIWEAEEVGAGWERFAGAEFSMHAVDFNRFIFVWTLHRRIGELRPPPRLNVLVQA
jgi:hypothetical protein